MTRFLLLILFCCHFYATAQNNVTKEKTLKQVLLYFENTQDVKFSYSDEVIQNKNVVINEKKQDIEAVIKKLQEQSGLRFKKVSNNRYAIILPTEKTSICGHLFSKETNQILVGASVLVKHTTKGVSSNINGFFELEDVYPRDTLRMSSIGYKPMEIKVSDFLFKDCLKLLLEEDITSLEEVIIRNYITNSITKTIDGAIVFNPKSQTVLPGLTDADVLLGVQQLPGVLTTDETASGSHIRGGSPDQNLILFNQIRLFNTAHFFGSISAINPQIVDKVTVYKTASNAKYGNHIAGVIDIKSKTDIPKKTGGSMGVNFSHFDANIHVPISPKLSVLVAGRHSNNGVFNSPTYNNLSKKAFQYTIISDNNQLAQKINGTTNTSLDYFDFNSVINYRPTKHDNIAFSQIKIKNDLDHVFSSNEIKEQRKDVVQIENEGYNLHWNKVWNKNTSHNMYTGFSNYKLRIRDDKINTENNTNYASIYKDNKVAHFESGINVNHKLSKKSSLDLGYQYVYNDISFLLQRIGESVKWESAEEENLSNSHTLFAGYLLKHKNDYAINIGARANYFSLLNKFTFEPRIFIQKRVLPKLWANTSFEIKQQNISKITENFTKDFGLENTSWVLSNNQRVPLLESRQITMGALYKNNNWLIDVDVYKRRITGLTSITSGFETTRGFYLGEGKTLGLDILLKKNWRFFNTWLSYQTGKTTFLFNRFNENKEFKGNFDVSHAFYWGNNITYKQFNFSLGWTYRVGVPFTSAFISDFPYLGRNEVNKNRLPDYHKLDFSCTYNFYLNKEKNIKSQLGLSILNVYDKENIIRRNYDVTNYENPEEGKLVQEDSKSLGFTPNLSFRVGF